MLLLHESHMSALFPNNVKTLLVEIEENLRKIYWRKMFRNVCCCPDKLSITIFYFCNCRENCQWHVKMQNNSSVQDSVSQFHPVICI
jgi:hypothetical protein